jgi:hypothetical protein
MEKCHRHAFSHFEMPCYRLSAQPDERDGCKPAEGWVCAGEFGNCCAVNTSAQPTKGSIKWVASPKKKLKSGDLPVT